MTLIGRLSEAWISEWGSIFPIVSPGWLMFRTTLSTSPALCDAAAVANTGWKFVEIWVSGINTAQMVILCQFLTPFSLFVAIFGLRPRPSIFIQRCFSARYLSMTSSSDRMSRNVVKKVFAVETPEVCLGSIGHVGAWLTIFCTNYSRVKVLLCGGQSDLWIWETWLRFSYLTTSMCLKEP